MAPTDGVVASVCRAIEAHGACFADGLSLGAVSASWAILDHVAWRETIAILGCGALEQQVSVIFWVVLVTHHAELALLKRSV